MISMKARREVAHKKKVLAWAKETGNVAKTCRYFGICRQTFYTWKAAYEHRGEQGLINNKPCPENPKLRTARLAITSARRK